MDFLSLSGTLWTCKLRGRQVYPLPGPWCARAKWEQAFALAAVKKNVFDCRFVTVWCDVTKRLSLLTSPTKKDMSLLYPNSCSLIRTHSTFIEWAANWLKYIKIVFSSTFTFIAFSNMDGFFLIHILSKIRWSVKIFIISLFSFQDTICSKLFLIIRRHET